MTNLRGPSSSCIRCVTTLVVGLLLSLLGAAGCSTAAQATQAARLARPAEGAPGLTVLIGTSGVTWSDVSAATPNLLSLTSWEAGSLAARSVGSYSCLDDGWLAISAGNRARSAVHGSAGCTTDQLTFSDHVTQAGRDSYGAEPGLLGRTLASAGVATYGIGGGARIALAQPGPTPGTTWKPRAKLIGPQVRSAVTTLGGGPGLLVVDLGAATAANLTDVDARLGDTLAALPSNATVIVASLADGSPHPHLQVVARRAEAPGTLTSESTRQPGYVTATDVAPTLLKALGVAVPSSMVGAPVSSTPVATTGSGTEAAQARLTQLRDPDRKAVQMNRVTPWVVVIVYLPIFCWLCWTWWRCSRRGLPWPAWLRPVASFLAVMPAATYLANLVPWWRSGLSLLWVIVALLVMTTVLALPGMMLAARLPARVRPWFRLGWPGLVTMLVFAADLLTGSRLQVSSLIGLQPLVAGRFYGLGNPQFAIFGSAALVLAGAIAGWLLGPLREGRLRAGQLLEDTAVDHWSRPRRLAAASVLTVAVLALALDGTPGLGSDFGGPPALFPAMMVLTTFVLGFRITWRRVLVVGLATVALVSAVCVVDWLRPAGQRTHLGRFVQTLIDGGGLAVLTRKLATNLHVLISPPFNALIPVVTLALGWYLLKPVPDTLRRTYASAPVVKQLLVAWFVMITLAFLLNDSGVIVPPLAAGLMMPALLSLLPWPAGGAGENISVSDRT